MVRPRALLASCVTRSKRRPEPQTWCSRTACSCRAASLGVASCWALGPACASATSLLVQRSWLAQSTAQSLCSDDRAACHKGNSAAPPDPLVLTQRLLSLGRFADARARRMVSHAPVRTVAPASAPGRLNELAGVACGARLRACRAFHATHPVRRAARGAAFACHLLPPRRQEPLAAVVLRAPARRLHAHRGAAVARSSRDPAGGEAVRTHRNSLLGRLFSPCPALQAPVNYQAVALTVGSAFAFGAGVYAFKGGDSVRSDRLFSCAGHS